MNRPTLALAPSVAVQERWFRNLAPLSLALCLAAVAALVWFTHAYDAEEQQAALISDALWMEQNLRFQLDRNEAQLQQIAPELLRGERLSTQTEAQLRQLLTQDRGLVRILWRDQDGRLVGASPPVANDRLTDERPAGEITTPEALSRLTRAIGRPIFGSPYPAADGQIRFEVSIPSWSDSAFLGTVIGVYSLSDLVVRELPWWFSERYRVAVLDTDGNEIAAKSKIAPLAANRSYTISLDPPGHGLVLQITPYKDETRWMPLLLGASIIVLGGIIVWSIWQLRRQLTRRQAAEQALLEESAYRKAMEDSLITGLRARDLDGRLTYVNAAFCRMTGYAATELIGQLPPLPYWESDHDERRRELQECLRDTGSTPNGVEIRFRRKNGDRLEVLLFEAPLIDAQGRHTGWMGSLLDITEQKRTRELAQQQEERLQATSRLVTMGEMASTLAHELNQPLTAIASYSGGCINRLEAAEIDHGELRDILAKLDRQAHRAGAIIRRVYDFVRRSEPKRELLDLNTVIRDAVDLIEADARKRRMRLTTELAPQLPKIAVDPVMIEQAIVNLVRNGMDAMRDTPAEQRRIHVTTTLDAAALEGGALVIRVTDHGCGIDADTARHLFQPFFTTKEEGMGMGLNICRSIAELHRGRLHFEPNPNGGTIFTLSLPLTLT